MRLLSSVQCLARAEDARQQADETVDPGAKRLMLMTATAYERMAAFARSRERRCCLLPCHIADADQA